MSDIPICHLCLDAKADNRNAHIIPKFFTKHRLFNDDTGESFSIDGAGKRRPARDSPKLDHLLCTQCEKKFEYLETYASKRFADFRNGKTSPKIKYREYCNVPRYEHLDFNPGVFKAFIYSIAWRASICTDFTFINFRLDETVEEEIRRYLCKILSQDYRTTIDNATKIDPSISYDVVLLQPNEKTKFGTGLVFAETVAPGKNILYLLDFACLFFTKQPPEHCWSISNKKSTSVKVGLLNYDDWIGTHALKYLELTGGSGQF